MMIDRRGQSIQGYELLERIGAGGFGAVYRALQSTVGREVAVKAILPTYANDPDFIRRFEMEAQLIARLEHLHIVPLYDFWRDPEGAYIVMRWLRGGNLNAALKDGPFDLEPAGLLLDQVAAGLAAAHDQRVIHRDLKPSNILLDEEGNAYLADFGIAMDLRGGHKQATEREDAGSFQYLSPEQLRGQEPTVQSDIYSLGITLYETLTGHHPFPSRTSVQQIFRHIDDPLPHVENLDPTVSEAVSEVIKKATDKNPAHRYPDALALATAFREAAQLGQNGQTNEMVESLTLREQEILRLIIEGNSNKEIAQTLFVELPTIKWHITRIYKKLGVRSRVQAIVRAREMNLIVFTDEHEMETIEPTQTSIVLPEPVNPYKGLMAFETADNRHFFGREKLVETLLSRLVEPAGFTLSSSSKNGHGRFLAIVGPSGSGKSSLVKAGLIPALWSGAVPGSDKWFIVDMAPGARPLDELEITLTRIASDQTVNLRQHLDRDSHGLSRAAALVLPNDNSELLLVVDQFEELFTLVDDEKVRNHFMALLHGAVTDPRTRVRVIITLRADFYDRPLQQPAFGQLVRDHLETLLPLSARELERAIINPAALNGVTFEPGLVATIIKDVNDRPGALPLLQYALTELFEYRQGRTMTGEAYTAIGGAAGALAGRAEELYQEQDDAGRVLINQMFLRLVTVGSPTGIATDSSLPVDIRQRVLRSELLSAAPEPDSLDEIIDTFAAYRLLSLDHHPATRQPTVEVAHEAILREWDRLRGWLEESQADLALHRQLIRATAEWLEAERDWSFLLRGSRLTQFEAWAEDSRIVLTDQEHAYLEASLANRREREAIERHRQEHEAQLERSSRRRLKALIAVMAGALAVAIGLSIAAIAFAGQAGEQRRLAIVRELATAALANLESNPERSILLAMEAAETTFNKDGSVQPEVEEILHLAVQADRSRLSIPMDGVVAFSADGKLLAIGNKEGDLVSWDATTGKRLYTYCCLQSAIMDVAFSPDGKYLAAAVFDSQVKIWETTSNGAIMNLKGHLGPVNDVAYGPDGKRLASAGEDGLIRIWDVSSMITEEITIGTFTQPMLRHQTEPARILKAPAEVTGVDFSRDGRRLAAYMPGSGIIVWDTEAGQQLLQVSGVSDSKAGVAFSPNGEYLVGASGASGATIWNAGTGEQVFTLLDSSPIIKASFSDDGAYLGTAAEDGTATLWDIERGQQTFKVSDQASGFNYVAFSSDGREMATGGDDGATRIWDLAPSRNAELLTVAAHEGELYDVIYDPAGTRFASTGTDGALKIWDTATGKLERSLAGRSGGVSFPTFSPDGLRLAAANNLGGASVWDSNSGEELVSLSGVGPAITTVSFSPDGRRLAAGGPEGDVAIWDATNGKLLTSFRHTSAIMRVLYSPGGGQIWAYDRDGFLSVWDINADVSVGQRDVCEDSIWDAEFSPDGRYLAAAGFDGLVHVFEDTSEGTSTDYSRMHTLYGHRGSVTGVAFHPEGTIIASASIDGMVKLWDLETGLEILTVTDQKIPLVGVDFSPDGRYVITAGSDGAINVYVAEVEELMDLARTKLSRDFTQDECQRYLHLSACPEE